MKLNLGLIIDSLQIDKDQIHSVILPDHDPMQFIDVIPYFDGFSADNPNVICIFHWKQLYKYSGALKYVICIGGGNTAEEFFKEHHCYGIIFKESTKLLPLSVNIRLVFNHYNKLELELLQLLYQDVSTKSLLNECANIFCAHVALYGSDFSLLEYSDVFLPTDEIWIKTCQSRRSIVPMFNRKDVGITPNQPSNYPSCSYISIDGFPPHFNFGFDYEDSRFATLIIWQSGQELNKSMQWLVDYIGKLLLPKITARYNSTLVPRNRLRNEIQFILRHKSKEILMYNSVFKKVNWEKEAVYRLAVVKFPVNSQSTTQRLYNYENIFADMYSNSVGVNFDENIVLVFYDSACDKLLNNMWPLKQQLQEDDAYCCIGEKFFDLSNITEQFEIIINCFYRVNSNNRIIDYKDKVSSFLITELNSLVNLRAVCHHAVSIINKHDKENGTDYLLTLETYLLNNKSLQEAANRLFVHKSTISYRLRCIGELVKIDYDDPMERLSVLISCIITRRFNEAESLKQ